MYFRSKFFAPETTRLLGATSSKITLSVSISETFRHFLAESNARQFCWKNNGATWSTLKQGLKYLRPIWSHMFQDWSIMFWYVLIVQMNVKKVLLLISSNLGKIQLLGNLLGILCVDEAKEVHFHVTGCVGLSGTIKLLDHGTSFHNSQSNLRFEDDIRWTNWRWLMAKWFPKMRKIFHKSAGRNISSIQKLSHN